MPLANRLGRDRVSQRARAASPRARGSDRTERGLRCVPAGGRAPFSGRFCPREVEYNVPAGLRRLVHFQETAAPRLRCSCRRVVPPYGRCRRAGHPSAIFPPGLLWPPSCHPARKPATARLARGHRAAARLRPIFDRRGNGLRASGVPPACARREVSGHRGGAHQRSGHPSRGVRQAIARRAIVRPPGDRPVTVPLSSDRRTGVGEGIIGRRSGGGTSRRESSDRHWSTPNRCPPTASVRIAVVRRSTSATAFSIGLRITRTRSSTRSSRPTPLKARPLKASTKGYSVFN